MDPYVLAAFESRLGGGLPADYFEWITRVGDGGARPMLGLLLPARCVGTRFIRQLKRL
ncbi:hypothetical protein [Rhodococcus oryzae]|uniref:hypothetical protein n=1 Tax=Rhodococcus oryzae TaxID=2571143 RepID=UPI00379DC5F8